MSMLIKPYEISIWDDILTYEVELDTGEILSMTPLELQNYQELHPDKKYNLLNQFYDERKIAIIGSNTLETPWRAITPSFKENVNGTHDLSFKMYAKYYDYDSELWYENPFVKKMVNERKAKLFYEGKWYDFVLKKIDENSSDYSFSYQFKDVFINELSKTGYNIEFNQELENNIGTISELSKKILEESDWDLGTCDIFRQYNEEPLYKGILNVPIQAKSMLTDEIISIEKGQTIYICYNSIDSSISPIQFIYNADGYRVERTTNVIDEKDNYSLEVVFDQDDIKYKDVSLFSFLDLSEEYRGKRLVRTPKTQYDSRSEKYVTSYNNGSIFGYQESEYITISSVQNYVTNPSSFVSTDGWKAKGNIKLTTNYPISELGDKTLVSYINYNWHDSANKYLINTGVSDNKSYINGFSKGEEYALKLKVSDKYKSQSGYSNIEIIVGQYEIQNGNYIIPEGGKAFFKYLNFKDNMPMIVSCTQSISYKEMLNLKIGIIIRAVGGKTVPNEIEIEELQFYPAIKGLNGKYIVPGEAPQSEVKTKYYFYEANTGAKKPDELEFSYSGYSIPENYKIDFNDTGNRFEKRRSITATESNRFNLIQNLCELFDCWAEFEVEHEDTGKIKLDANKKQIKRVNFKEYGLEDYPVGFTYGRNLKAIRRSLDSEPVANKLIVKPNSNEFAENGFCTIARASENPIKETFILDFSLYFMQGLLNSNQFDLDLYATLAKEKDKEGHYYSPTGYLGYYKKLKKLNEEIEPISEQMAQLTSTTIPKLQSSSTTYQIRLTSTQEEVNNIGNRIKSITGLTPEKLNTNTYKPAMDWKEDNEVNGLMISYFSKKQSISTLQDLVERYKKSLDDANEQLKRLEARSKEIVEEKKFYNKQFYNKYSRFIQEGAWISEDYIDENLYYLDAKSTLHTSCQPKVTYTIDVLEISQLEGLEAYKAQLGKKTYIEDTEFFGWADSLKTIPYREEVIVTEITHLLDEPEKDTVTVKNYKTQFEDLFQRVNAITTAIEFSTGEYNKVAGIIDEQGNIKINTLQNSLINNSIVIQNSNNQSVLWDESGITTIDMDNPLNMVRIVGGGVFISSDGGATWQNGITGRGISANYITTGIIDVQKIRILNGAAESFAWDSKGITAYSYTENAEKGTETYDSGKYVRLDQFGLYGVNDGSVAFDNIQDPQTCLKGISDNAWFYLTWEGFGLKTQSGAVTITSKDEIQVWDKNGQGQLQERIKIGSLGNDLYGMRLKDSDGNVTLETGDNGQLYLRKTLLIGPRDNEISYDPRVALGVIGSYHHQDVEEDYYYSKIFSVENHKNQETIAFYDDGRLIAKRLEAEGAKISGTIEAGSIISSGCSVNTEGGLVELGAYIKQEAGTATIPIEAKISSDVGSIIHGSEKIQSITLTANLLRQNNEIDQDGSNFSYEWYYRSDKMTDFVKIADTQKQITVSLIDEKGAYIFNFSIRFQFRATEKATGQVLIGE